MDKLKYKIQRAKKGYSDEDLWNFDEYLARVIKEGCFILAENFNGYPNEFENGKKWKQVLLNISFGFGSYLEMRSGVYKSNDKEFKRLNKEFENSKKLFIKYFESLWD